MGTKTISIMDDVYDTLVALKAPHESFSDELRRLSSTKGSIMELAGAWKDFSEEEAKKMKEAIHRMRGGKRTEEIIKRLR